MIINTKLTDEIKSQLPAELVNFSQTAGEMATRMGLKLYLVGGVVRDLLLRRPNLDLDLVAEGDAIGLAEKMARLLKGKVIAHSRFNTAKIKWDKWSVDIASARAEGYEKPGSLPTVQPSDIRADLIRRDFTINAMAIDLNPAGYGDLIDLYKGQLDLERKIIRILHDNSFKDDATRIWRAVRYEQRLNFHIESHTLDLLKRDISYLDTISGDRIRHELELCLEEEYPERALLRASQLGLLQRVCSSLNADEWLAKRFSRARGMLQPFSPPPDLYLSFLVYHLNLQALDSLISYLKFPRITAQILEDTLHLKAELPFLDRVGLPPSRIYHTLNPYSQQSILANLLCTDSHLVRQHIELYLNRLKNIQISLTGEDLIQLGIATGPRIKETLELLREAKLDGKITTCEQEMNLVKKLI